MVPLTRAVRNAPRFRSLFAASVALVVAVSAAGTGLLYPEVCAVCGGSQLALHKFLGVVGGLLYCAAIACLAFRRAQVAGTVLEAFSKTQK